MLDRLLPHGVLRRQGQRPFCRFQLGAAVGAVQIRNAGYRLLTRDTQQQTQLRRDGEAAALLGPQQTRLAADQLHPGGNIPLLTAGRAVHDLGEGHSGGVCMQLLLLAAIQGTEGQFALYQQLGAHQLTGRDLGIQAAEEQVLRCRLAGRYRDLTGDGTLTLRHGGGHVQLMLPAAQPQGGVLLHTAAQLYGGAGIAADRPLRHQTQGQTAGRQCLGLAQQQPSGGPQHLAGRQGTVLRRADKGHRLGQAPQSHALL